MSQFPNCSRAGLEVKSLPAVDKRYKEIIAAKDVERYLASRMSVDDIIKCREAIKAIKDHYENERTVHLPETGSYVPKDNMSQKAENNDTLNKHVAGGEFFKPDDFGSIARESYQVWATESAKTANRLLQERGTVVYGRKTLHGRESDPWVFYDAKQDLSETRDTHTALLINIQPVAKPDTAKIESDINKDLFQLLNYAADLFGPTKSGEAVREFCASLKTLIEKG